MTLRRLQVKIGNTWKYVFCSNIQQGIITTENRNNAVYGERALMYFSQVYSDFEFKLENGLKWDTVNNKPYWSE